MTDRDPYAELRKAEIAMARVYRAVTGESWTGGDFYAAAERVERALNTESCSMSVEQVLQQARRIASHKSAHCFTDSAAPDTPQEG
jgi:hypothetical protein